MTDITLTDVPNQRQPMLSRPPVEGTDEEIDAWADAFVEAVLGPPGQELGALEALP